MCVAGADGGWLGRGGVELLGLMRFSFCRRLQNQTRITSFSMLSCSAISMISSEVGFWFCWRGQELRSPSSFAFQSEGDPLTVMKARSRATRTFVSMLVLFFLRRPGIPSKPKLGEDRELGLGRVLSIDMVSEGGEHPQRQTVNYSSTRFLT